MPLTVYEVLDIIMFQCCIECNHVSGGAVGAIIVTMNGVVRYQKNKLRTISQTFILAQEPGKASWKVASDCMRTFE